MRCFKGCSKQGNGILGHADQRRTDRGNTADAGAGHHDFIEQGFVGPRLGGVSGARQLRCRKQGDNRR